MTQATNEREPKALAQGQIAQALKDMPPVPRGDDIFCFFGRLQKWFLNNEKTIRSCLNDALWNFDLTQAPHMKPVLLHYKNVCGKDRVIKAKFVPKFTEVAEGDALEWAEYSEEKDEYYIPEGWCELVDNWDEWSSITVCSTNKLIAWRTVPAVQENA